SHRRARDARRDPRGDARARAQRRTAHLGERGRGEPRTRTARRWALRRTARRTHARTPAPLRTRRRRGLRRPGRPPAQAEPPGRVHPPHGSGAARMNAVRALVLADWSLLVRDRVALFLTFVLPPIFFAFFATIFGGMSGGDDGSFDPIGVVVI